MHMLLDVWLNWRLNNKTIGINTYQPIQFHYIFSMRIEQWDVQFLPGFLHGIDVLPRPPGVVVFSKGWIRRIDINLPHCPIWISDLGLFPQGNDLSNNPA